MSGDQESHWKRTGSFSPQEGGLGSASTLCWSWWAQGAKLLGKDCGMSESRDISLHTSLEGRRAAQGDGTTRGWVGQPQLRLVLPRLRAVNRKQP